MRAASQVLKTELETDTLRPMYKLKVWKPHTVLFGTKRCMIEDIVIAPQPGNRGNERRHVATETSLLNRDTPISALADLRLLSHSRKVARDFTTAHLYLGVLYHGASGRLTHYTTYVTKQTEFGT